MKPPIILNESNSIDLFGDLTFFPSVKAVESYVEPIDVQNEEYFAFDSEGRLLQLETGGKRCQLIEAESQPTHQPLLRAVLLDLFRWDRADEAWLQSASLEELVSQGAKRFRVVEMW